ncbi:hypothetical protein [Kitasatospora aureofaciens]|uniref:hypothetical protein n=1 Tax=Kitasatospora aureofaciens TaxID=1894 RepID=UPI0033CF32D3
MLNAIREDQIEQRQTLTKLAEAVGALVVGQGERASVLAEHGKVLPMPMTTRHAIRWVVLRVDVAGPVAGGDAEAEGAGEVVVGQEGAGLGGVGAGRLLVV